jgi:transposase InsO family protein
MAVSSYAIAKLNGTNYLNWAVDVKYLLIERGLWDIIADSKPGIIIPGTKPGTVETKPIDSKPEELEKYKSRARVCLSIIYLNIEPEYRKIIENCGEDPVEAWRILKLNFCPDSRSSHMRLFTELIECKIRPRETINLFAARLLRISNQIIDINPKFDSTYTSFQLLRYLPSSFDGIVQSILRWSDERFTFNNITTELVAEEVRLNVRDQDRGRTSAELQVVCRKKTVVCWKCGKPGHVISQCRSGLTNDKGKQNSNPQNYPHGGKGQQSNGASNNRQIFNRKGKPQFRNNLKTSFFISEASLTENVTSESWLFDTGASHHFCCNKKLFTEFKPLENENLVVAVKDLKFPIEGVGVVELRFKDNVFRFTDTMYSSKLRRNLISGPRMDIKGAKFIGGNRQVKIFKNNEFQFRAYLRKGVYRLYPKIPNQHKTPLGEVSSTAKSEASRIELWHRRLGHISPSLMVNTSKKKCVRGLPDFRGENLQCDLCKLGKFRRVSFRPIDSIRTKAPLELIYADVWGPCHIEGRNNERYFLSIIDDFSRRVTLYPLHLKSDVTDIFIKHINRSENILNSRVKSVRTDNGGEFNNEILENFFAEKGIRHEVTNPYTPEQNGVAERFNQTVADGIRTLLEESGLDANFWPEALTYFSYTWNCICPQKLSKTPTELYSGKTPSVNHLRIFGSVVYVGIPRQKRNKLDLKAKRGIMVGYAFRTRGYRVWLPEENRVIETANVSFNEKQMYKDLVKAEIIGREAIMGSMDYNLIKFSVDEEVTIPKEIDDSPGTSTDAAAPESSDGPKQDVIWRRQPKPRKDGSRVDVYYYEKNKPERLRSINDVQTYCDKNNIEYHPEIFNFKGDNDYTGYITNSGEQLEEEPLEEANQI